jgi:hypothetical protein
MYVTDTSLILLVIVKCSKENISDKHLPLALTEVFIAGVRRSELGWTLVI